MVNYQHSNKNQEIYSLANIAGLDFNNSPLNIGDNQSPSALNVYFEDGTINKRWGTMESCNADNVWKKDIKSFYYLPSKHLHIVNTGNQVIVSSGSKRTTFKSECLYGSSSFMVYQNDKVYIFGNYGICVVETEPELVIRDLEEHELYAPITTTNLIASNILVDETAAINVSFEPVNMMTKWRQNTALVSNKTLESFTEDSNNWETSNAIPTGETCEITLDGFLERDKLVNTKMTLDCFVAHLVRKSDDENGDYYAYTIKNGMECVISTVANENSNPTRKKYYYTITAPCCSIDGNTIDKDIGELIVDEENSLTKIALYYDLGNPNLNTPNLTIKYCAKTSSDLTSRILDCKFGIVYQDGTNLPTLFVSGNSKFPNIDWHSAGTAGNGGTYSDFTYFPDTSYTALGDDNSSIVGYQISNDGYLITYKSQFNDNPTLYYRKANLSYIGTGVGNEALYDLVFPVSQGVAGATPSNNKTIINFYNENLFFSSNGVYALTIPDTLEGTTKYAYPRSTLINNVFKNETMSKACAISHNNRLFIAFSDTGHCFMADNRNLVRVGANTEYQWWMFNNIHAQEFYVAGNELYFINERGRPTKFDGTLRAEDGTLLEEFADTQVQHFPRDNGFIGHHDTNNYYTFDVTQLTPEMLGDSNMTEIISDDENQNLYLASDDIVTIYKIKKIDFENGRIYMENSTYDYDNGLIDGSNAGYIHILISRPYLAFVDTKPIIFNNFFNKKNVTQLMFTSGAYKQRCQCSISISTRGHERTLNPMFIDPIDLDYSSLSFEEIFFERPTFDIKSRVIPLHMKNINSLSIRFSNRGFTNMAVTAVQLLYQYSGKNRGYN